MIHNLYSIPNHYSFPSSNPLYQSIFPSPSTQRKTKYLSKKLNQYSNYQHKKRKTLLILFMMGFLICIFILYKGNSIQLKKINNKHTPLSSGSFLRTNENNPPRRLIDTSTPFPIHHKDLNRIHKMTESILTYHHTHPDPPHYLYGYIVNKDLSILFITLKSIYTPHNKYVISFPSYELLQDFYTEESIVQYTKKSNIYSFITIYSSMIQSYNQIELKRTIELYHYIMKNHLFEQQTYYYIHLSESITLLQSSKQLESYLNKQLSINQYKNIVQLNPQPNKQANELDANYEGLLNDHYFIIKSNQPFYILTYPFFYFLCKDIPDLSLLENSRVNANNYKNEMIVDNQRITFLSVYRAIEYTKNPNLFFISTCLKNSVFEEYSINYPLSILNHSLSKQFLSSFANKNRSSIIEYYKQQSIKWSLSSPQIPFFIIV